MTEVEAARIVTGVQQQDADAAERLYALITRIANDEDLAHDCYLMVFQSIWNGDVREPGKLERFVRVVITRARYRQAVDPDRLSAFDEDGAPPDRSPSPYDILLEMEWRAIVARGMDGLKARERSLLYAFYFGDVSAAQIKQEMNLTDTQFRLLKSRAKARLAERCRRLSGLTNGSAGGPSRSER